ncbi:MAG: ABC transporter permease subunit [Chloroflexota bacterium]|nr:ABC transporter permease subunit [Chloroflexota bacterium]
MRWLLRGVVAALAVLLLFAPVGVFVLYAFSTGYFYPQLVPTRWTAAPFLRQLADPRTRQAFGLSVQIASVVSVLSLLVAYPAARTLGTRQFRGKRLVYLLLFVPTVVPPVATGIGLNILFLRLDLAGTVLGVALVHLIPVLPYTVFTLAGMFAQYDPHYEYQARVLGAGPIHVFGTVTLPLILPSLVVATLFAFLISWSQYLLTFLIGGGRVVTLPILLFATVAGGNPTTLAGLSLLFVAPLIVLLVATARYLATDQLLGTGGSRI